MFPVICDVSSCTKIYFLFQYFSTYITWSIYCVTIAVLIATLKILNLGFHSMYDRAQAMSDTNIKGSTTKGLRETSGDEDAGIEMQVLGSSEMPSRISLENASEGVVSGANSAVSIDFPEPVSSTIDFKVDVHRKNSSESSDSVTSEIYSNFGPQPVPNQNNIEAGGGLPSSSSFSAGLKSNGGGSEFIGRDLTHLIEAAIEQERDEAGANAKQAKKTRKSLSKEEKRRGQHYKLERQTSLDWGDGPRSSSGRPSSSSKLQRHRSSDDQEVRRHQHSNKNKSNVSLILPSTSSSSTGNQHHHHHHHHHHHSSVDHQTPGTQTVSTNPHSRLQQSLASSDLYLSENNYTTKSELAIETIPPPPRRDSNSTMSALQLPTTSALSMSRGVRRHSNTGKSLGGGGGGGMLTSVRRIKSAALEVGCPQPSVSNLTPHPNSVEAITGGPVIRNPPHAILPAPSKCLSRNPHLNLFPTAGNLNSDPVYPIAEQAGEEGGASTNTNRFRPGSADSDDDKSVEEELGTLSNPLESDGEELEERLRTQSTDSDTENNNNGSRSPLLDMKDRIVIVEQAVSAPIETTSTSAKPEAQTGPFGTSPIQMEFSKSAFGELECPSSDGDQASAGSKDMLLTTKEEPHYVNMNCFRSQQTPPDDDPSSSVMTEALDAPIRCLGAIPKSRIRTSARRFSGDEHYHPPRNIALPRNAQQTPITPVLTFLNARIEPSIIPLYASPCTGGVGSGGSGSDPPMHGFCRIRPRTYAVLEPNRHRQPKIRRSTRSKHLRPQPVVVVDGAGNGGAGATGTSITAATTTSSSLSRGVVDGSETVTASSSRAIINSITVDQYMQEVWETVPNHLHHHHDSHQFDAIFMRNVDFSAEPNFVDFNRHYIAAQKPAQPKRYYKLSLDFFGKRQIRVAMDRLQLLALFDRDTGWPQAVLAIILAALVSVLGAIVLSAGFYQDLFAFIFCIVIAGSQYSLLKSVQPDAASPIHGFNKTVAYSRPIYFCLCSGLLLLANYLRGNTAASTTLTIFGFPYGQRDFFVTTEYILANLLLLFPVLFSLGLFPQINTFLIYLIEQIDMHVFGGNAVCSLGSAFISLARSVIACLLLYGPVFGGLSEPRGTQHVLFSMFCAMLIPIGYHLARSASDFSCIWNLIKASLLFHPDDEEDEDEDNETGEEETGLKGGGRKEQKSPTTMTTSQEEDDRQSSKDGATQTEEGGRNDESTETVNNETELIDPLPKKLQSTVNNRLKHDLLICSVLGLIVMSLHSSTVFTVLQPELNYVLYALAIIFGVVLHYIMPQMRKHLPWLCVARPILRQQEHGQFEAKEASKVMWFEQSYVILCFLERNILYPLIFLSALTADSSAIANKYGVSLGAAIVTVCGLKCK